ncbi:phosphodiester glycosidase family protein [Streptomyces qinzhouensis]|uniref:Multidrug transporter n=1 Tax=Streptomyces qinzhouensis TaxID=2599401 RepID=A0A5B8IBA5_9ACTN|nr:phosphodiester glycosidase family protein [Streptomyces qinzhouensis]QDY75358.1 multidrug transporter [Streptomyces qinzhouensis]
MDRGRARRRARRTPVLIATLSALSVLTAGTLSPAVADPRRPPATTAESLRPVTPPPASNPTTNTPATADGDGIETARTSRPVAPGITLTSYDRLEADKWLRVDSLAVGLDHEHGTGVDHLSAPTVTGRDTVTALAAAHDPGPGRRTVAAVNGDFFDLNRTGAPLGPGIRGGAPTHSPAPGSHQAVGIGPGGAGRVLRLYFDGTLTLPSGPGPLTAYNAARVPLDGVGAYTPAWGSADRALTVGPATRVAEALVRDGTVLSVADRTGTGPVPAGATALVGREAGAGRLLALRPGDPVSLSFRPRTDRGPVPRTAVGGRELLVVDGVPRSHDGQPNNAPAPRTAVGFSADGRTMRIVTVDGRQADSGGVTLTELGRMMADAGAHNALNLDGGGSTTLAAREPGSDTLRIENSPSDGAQRPVPNGLAFTAPDGSGRLRGYRVETRTPPADAPTASPVRGGRPDRVFPGLTRTLTATGYDETYGPAAGTPRWRSTAPAVGRVDARGVFRALRGGTASVRAERGTAHGAVDLTVLGPLTALEPTTRRVSLADAAARGGFGLLGRDAHGNSAPVEPADVRLDYDRERFTVRDDGTGSFTVTARPTAGPGAAGRITATAAGVTTVLAVGVGLTEETAAAFDDAAAWTFGHARAGGSVAATPTGNPGTALELSYDFARSTATRAAYANPPRAVPVPGQPQSFGLRVDGDGRGAWPTLHLKDAAGSDHLLRGPYITWTGWRQITFAVPPGVAGPLTVHRFYLAETAADRQYTGRITIDTLTARVPPAVDLPAPPRTADPLIGTAARAGARDRRFAVMSDAQFVARDPDSAIVRQARRTLREIRAARPDFLVVNGDLVDEGSPQDLAFARRVLTEELGSEVPWYYVPGNHEVMGGRIGHFTAEFGPASRVLDHHGTRIVTLDTSSLSLRGGGLAQITAARAALDDAARDPDIDSVLVVEHVPPRDPTPQQGSRLGDRKEAALLETWLADFRRTTGKGVGFIGAHAGVFHADRVDGVPYLVNGNSGKAPAGPAGEGGFTGWSLVGVDRIPPAEQLASRGRPWLPGPDWLTVQTRAHTDGLTLTSPTELRAGSTATIRATVAQGARAVPAAHPVSTDWTASDNVRIDARGTDGRDRPVAAFTPATGLLTALRPGTVTLAVTVSGVTRRTTITITADARRG